MAVLLLAASGACGGTGPVEREPSSRPRLHYTALTLSKQVSYLTLSSAPPWVFVYLESEGARGLEVDLLAVSHDGAERSRIRPLARDLESHFGDPVVAGGELLVGGLRQGATRAGTAWVVWRWRPGSAPSVLLQCELPRLRSGQLAVDATALVVVFEDELGALYGFRTPIATPACPEPEAIALLMRGPVPVDHRVDWLGDQLAVTGRWGETVAIQLFGRRFEPLRRLRLETGAAMQTRDVAFFRRADGAWVVIFSARPGGAGDLYLAPLVQWRAGPLAAVRVVATAEAERRPRLIAHGEATVVQWGNADSRGDEWIETVALLAPYAIALPGGEVVWRRPLGEGQLGRSIWTDVGLLRFRVEPRRGGSMLTVSPYRPSFW